MFSRFVILASLLAFTPAAFAETFFLRPLKSEVLTKEDTASVNELMRMAAEGTEGATITQDEKAAEAILEPKVVKLGSTYIVSVSKIRGDKVVFSQQARSSTIEDMDTVANRVMRATINEVDFKADTRVTDVTQDQVSRGTRRIEATRQWYFGFGPASGNNLNTNNSGYFWQLGYSWGIDPHWSINLALEAANLKNTNAYFSNLQLSGDYFFTENSTTPYVTVGFGHGSAAAQQETQNFLDVSDDTASGFTGSVGAGYRFFRTSSVNLGVGAKYTMIFDKTSHGNPSMFTGAVTVYF